MCDKLWEILYQSKNVWHLLIPWANHWPYLKCPCRIVWTKLKPFRVLFDFRILFRWIGMISFMGTKLPKWYSQYNTMAPMTRPHWKSEHRQILDLRSMPKFGSCTKRPIIVELFFDVLLAAKVRATLKHTMVWSWLIQLSMKLLPVTLDRQFKVQNTWTKLLECTALTMIYHQEHLLPFW